MTRSLALSILILAGANFVLAAESVPSGCEQLLVRGNYCLPSQAEVICQMMPRPVVSCAMDMVDMKMASDIFDAVEYCRFPYPAPKAP